MPLIIECTSGYEYIINTAELLQVQFRSGSKARNFNLDALCLLYKQAEEQTILGSDAVEIYEQIKLQAARINQYAWAIEE